MSSSPTSPDSSPSPSTAQNVPDAPPPGGRIKRWIVSSARLHAVIIGALFLALVALGILHVIELNRVRDAAADQRAAVVMSATQALTDQTSSLLRMSALPLGWAMRSALVTNDFSTADAYLQRIVQEKHVTGIALVTADGKVRLAGSRKLEGRRAAEVFPGVALNASAPAVVSSDHDLRVVVPIMEIDRRLGTLIVSYAAPRVDDVGGASGRR